jgi:hypothetical protein
MACYRDSFTFLLSLWGKCNKPKKNVVTYLVYRIMEYSISSMLPNKLRGYQSASELYRPNDRRCRRRYCKALRVECVACQPNGSLQLLDTVF